METKSLETKKITGGMDLHCHSTLSDGAFSVEKILEKARKMGLSALALTDHNLVAAYPENMDDSLLLIRGCEFSSLYFFQSTGITKEIHVIGLFLEENDKIREVLRINKSERNDDYIKEIIRNLQKIGFKDITFDLVREMFPDTVLTRSNIAKYMEVHKMVETGDEAFDKYFGNYEIGLPCYVNSVDYNHEAPLEQVIESIMSVPGAVPVLCHPLYYHNSMEEERELFEFFSKKTEGRGAVEVYYGDYTIEQIEKLQNMAREYHLMMSCGSDFHGRKEQKLGSYPRELLDIIMNSRG